MLKEAWKKRLWSRKIIKCLFILVAPEMSVSVWEQVIHRENEELRHLEGDGAESSATRSVLHSLFLSWMKSNRMSVRVIKNLFNLWTKVTFRFFLARGLSTNLREIRPSPPILYFSPLNTCCLCSCLFPLMVQIILEILITYLIFIIQGQRDLESRLWEERLGQWWRFPAR